MTKKTALVKLRHSDVLKRVSITSNDKPEIIRSVTEKWQKIISLISRLMSVPTALIMRVTEEDLQVFLRSNNNENPYQEGCADSLGKGLYCETVIGTNRELLVANSQDEIVWEDNPDVEFGMVSYFGLPIQWPDAETFGTICVLDSKENPYNETFMELMNEFRLSIEKDLELLVNRDMLKVLAERDMLTSLFNRRKMSETLALEFGRSIRYRTSFSIALIDLDDFKQVNDIYGHDVGDQVIEDFSRTLCSRIRSVDTLGRWGGDEFLLICPNTDCQGVTSLLGGIRTFIEDSTRSIAVEVDFSFGIAEFRVTDQSPDDLFKRADEDLYLAKARKISSSASSSTSADAAVNDPR